MSEGDDTPDESGLAFASEEMTLNQLAGLFDTPAFARRGAELEYHRRRIGEHLVAQRHEMLLGVRLALQSWQRLSLGIDDHHDQFLDPLLHLFEQAGLESTRSTSWSARRGWRFRRRRVADQIIASGERFNERWISYLQTYDLTLVNRRIHDYNRYYLLEKECVVGSPRLASRRFEPMALISPEILLARHRPLVLPRRVLTR